MTAIIRSVAAAALLAMPLFVHAQTVVDTFGPGESSNTPGIQFSRSFGLSMTVIDVRFVCPVGYSAPLRSLTVGMYAQSNVPLGIAFEVFDDMAGQPGTVLEALPLVLNSNTDGVYTVNSVTRPNIDGGPLFGAGRPYWVRAYITSSPFISGAARWQVGPSPTAAIGEATYRTCDFTFAGNFCFNAGPTDPLPALKVIIGDTGACCSSSSYCAVVTPEHCNGFGGTFHGYGTACNIPPLMGGIACPLTIELGGCCVPGGLCVVTTPTGCEGVQGSYHGPCLTCSIPSGANPCCAADINNSGAVSTQDLFDFLGAFFTGCP